MEKKPAQREAVQGPGNGPERGFVVREDAGDGLRVRALATGQLDQVRARTEAEAARIDELMEQMREANEKLVLATMRADQLADEANAARAIADAAEAKAHASNRAKDEFLAMLGHELRNPLSPILTALELIALRGDDPHVHEHEVMERQVKYLIQLVDDLLDVSRITRGKIELKREPIELADVVSRAVELASPLLEAKAHALTVDVATRGLVVDGDLTRLAQAVGNLLTNAAKYTPSHGSIAVTGERRGSTVTLRVRDSGIGISPEMLPRVFDLFAQESQSADRSVGGLGIGLAIVRSLVAMHGGTVTAHSEGLGHGSELVVTLPSSTQPTGATVPKAPARRRATVAVPRKVLVVDDNPDSAELIAEALTALGHDARAAYDGPSAFAHAKNFVPDVVLLDIGLPVMDGYAVATRLREQLAPHAVRFIAITGYGQPINIQRSAEAGFAEHLVKPVDIAKIQRTIEATEPAR